MNVFAGLVDTDRSRHSKAMLRYVLKEIPLWYSRHSSGGRSEARTARESAVILTATVGVMNATLLVQTGEIK